MSVPAQSTVGVGSWIERRARLSPDRAALIAGGRPVTYAALAERVRRLANGLARIGVGHGDRIAWQGPNHPAFLEALFAAGRLGAVLAPVNHRLPPDERAFVLEDTEPVVVVEHRSVGVTRLPRSVRRRLLVGASPTGRTVGEAAGEPIERALGDAGDYEPFVTASPDDPLDVRIAPDDLLLLPHTSGTTGRPKGVMLTHANVTWNVVNFLTSADFRGDDVTVAIAPFFRVGGTGVNVLPVLFMGGTVVIPEDQRGETIVELMERYRVTVGFGNPDLLDAVVGAARWPVADLSSIRFILTGGAPVPERLIRAYHERGVPLVQGYGLSEAAPLVLLLDAGRSLEKIGSAGRPPLLVDVRIVGPDGRDVTPGATGELVVRGPNVMAGYWRRPADTARVLSADGWLRTGDAARMDDEGDITIVDRADAAFVAAGRTVYPGDVERVLLLHPLVVDAGVVGAPTAADGQRGAAFVVARPGSSITDAELVAFARERLAPHEVPESVRFVDELPRNSVGKLRREELQGWLG